MTGAIYDMPRVSRWITNGAFAHHEDAPSYHDLHQLEHEGLIRMDYDGDLAGVGRVIMSLTALGRYEADRQAAIQLRRNAPCT